jgi:hypothetical protein
MRAFSGGRGRRDARPGVVAAAAVLLLIGGVLNMVGGLTLLSAGGLFSVVAGVLLVVGAIQFYASILVINLRETGRKLVIGLAAVSGVFALLSVTRTPVAAVITIGIDAFIIWALVENDSYFSV